MTVIVLFGKLGLSCSMTIFVYESHFHLEDLLGYASFANFVLEAEDHSRAVSNKRSPALQIPLPNEGFLEALPKAISPKLQENPSCTICCMS